MSRRLAELGYSHWEYRPAAWRRKLSIEKERPRPYHLQATTFFAPEGPSRLRDTATLPNWATALRRELQFPTHRECVQVFQFFVANYIVCRIDRADLIY